MEFKLFGAKPQSVGDIEQTQARIGEKRSRLMDELSDARGRLSELEAEYRNVTFEVILEDSPDANRRKNALTAQTSEFKRRIESMVEQLDATEALHSELESRLIAARNREIQLKFDRNVEALLDLCSDIQPLVAQLGPKLREGEAIVSTLNALAWNPTAGIVGCHSAWVDGIGALLALNLDGVLPCFPTRADYRKDTLAGAASLRAFMERRLDVQREKLEAGLRG